jgi:putative ABC transport system permease protein
MKPGLPVNGAQSKVDALVASVRKQFPSDYPAESAWTVRLISLRESVAGSVRRSLYLLLGSVGLVLLIGCANIANLLLARGSARSREMALRQALGAGRGRLTRQLLTESLLLSMIGGMAGLAVLYATKELLLQLVPESLPRLTEISINGDVLLFAFGAAVFSGAIFGMAPALQTRKLGIAHPLKQQGRGNSGSGTQGRTRRVLVVTEFALSVVLMITATLLLRSFWDLVHVPLGFNPESVMAVRTRLPYPNDIQADLYRTVGQKAAFVHELVRRARTLPGVTEIAMGNGTSVPLDHARQDENYVPVLVDGRGTPANAAPLVDSCLVTPEYFHLMGMTLERGRFFGDFDTEKTAGVAVINAAMAQMFWPNEDAIGKRLRLNPAAPSWVTVIGIMANARTEALDDGGIPQIYSSLYQRGSKRLVVFLKGHLDTAAIPDQVRAQVQAVDARLPVFSAQTLSRTVSAALDQRRFSMALVGAFALVALLLAALGIYGVISYTVGERTHEIGIRLALGADRGRIMDMVLRQGLRLTIAGAALGLAGAWTTSHFMAGLLYGVSPGDPLTFAGVIVLFAAIAFAACYIPARRAMELDPLSALRHD